MKRDDIREALVHLANSMICRGSKYRSFLMSVFRLHRRNLPADPRAFDGASLFAGFRFWSPFAQGLGGRITQLKVTIM